MLGGAWREQVLKNHKHGWVFAEPVDPVKLQIPVELWLNFLIFSTRPSVFACFRVVMPHADVGAAQDYFNVIKRPMDLGTVKVSACAFTLAPARAHTFASYLFPGPRVTLG